MMRQFVFHAIRRTLLLAALMLAGSSCAPQHSGPSVARGSFSVITREELEQRRWPNLFEAVSVLRPQWFQQRGPDSLDGRASPLQVYLDGTRLLGMEGLRQISIDGVERVEFVNAIDAAARWGLDHGQGAIVVTTHPPQ